jgi:hypothetical protein
VRLGQICLNLVSNVSDFLRLRLQLSRGGLTHFLQAIRFTAAAPKRRIIFHFDVRRSPPADDSCRVPPKDLTDDLLSPDTSYYFYGGVEDTGRVHTPTSSHSLMLT